MTLQELFRKHEFESIVPLLIAIDEKNVPDNLYAFKEAFDDLRRMTPGDSGGEQIVVSTEVETDEDGNEIERYLYASNCEAQPWDECLAKEVIFGSVIGEEKALAQILWHMTFYGFSPEQELFPDRSIQNKYEQKAKELERRQFLNYAKGIAHPFEIEHLCLSMEGWEKYHQREVHRNRAKRMRDARQERSIARLERMGKVQRLIDKLLPTTPVLAASDYAYLFDTSKIWELEFNSRTPDVASRAEYIADNIRKNFHFELTEYTRMEMVVCCSSVYPATAEELRILCKAIFPLMGLTLDEEGHTISSTTLHMPVIKIHHSHIPTLGHDFHILLAVSR